MYPITIWEYEICDYCGVKRSDCGRYKDGYIICYECYYDIKENVKNVG